jgi:hypothetical protein
MRYGDRLGAQGERLADHAVRGGFREKVVGRQPRVACRADSRCGRARTPGLSRARGLRLP